MMQPGMQQPMYGQPGMMQPQQMYAQPGYGQQPGAVPTTRPSSIHLSPRPCSIFAACRTTQNSPRRFLAAGMAPMYAPQQMQMQQQMQSATQVAHQGMARARVTSTVALPFGSPANLATPARARRALRLPRAAACAACDPAWRGERETDIQKMTQVVDHGSASALSFLTQTGGAPPPLAPRPPSRCDRPLSPQMSALPPLRRPSAPPALLRRPADPPERQHAGLPHRRSESAGEQVPDEAAAHGLRPRQRRHRLQYGLPGAAGLLHDSVSDSDSDSDSDSF